MPYLNHLKTAFEQVSYDFYQISGLNQQGQNAIQRPENNFSCELIRRLRNQSESQVNQNYYRGLRFDFDLLKPLRNMKPDIVLHNNADNQVNQVLYIEVKTNPRSPLADDIRKIKRAITDLNFSTGIMIVLNKTHNNTINIIRRQINGADWQEFALEKIKLFHGEIYQGNIIRSYYSLDNLNNQIEW